MVCTAVGQFPTDSKPQSNLRQKYFQVATDSIKLDSLSIVPNSIKVYTIAADDFRIDYINAILYWNVKPVADSILISYRVFPSKLNRIAYRMRYDSLVNYTVPFTTRDEFLEQQQGGTFSFGNIRAEGSFGRQLAFG